MIRVAAISHAYLEAFTRPGIIDPGRYPEFETTAIVPRHLADENPEGYQRLSEECHAVLKVPAFANFHHSVRAYSPELPRLLRKIEPDIVFINNEPWSTTVIETVLACKMDGLKSKIVVYTCENQKRKYVFPFNLFEKYVLRKIDAAAVLARVEGETILRSKGYAGRIDYLPLGVNTVRFKKAAGNLQLPLDIEKRANTLVFGYIGRLVPEKGIRTVLYALKEMDEGFHFVVIGKGPQRHELVRLSSGLGIENRVTFIDGVAHDALPGFINSLDAVVLPSLTTKNWKEQFGRVLIEAMACEVPVIGSSSGEIPEVIGDGGLVFREGDEEDLKAKLFQIRNDPEGRRKIGKNGRQRVIERYSTDVVMARTAEIYKELIGHETSH